MKAAGGVDVRVLAARIIADVIDQKDSLARLLPPAIAQCPSSDKGLLQDLCYGVCRWYPKLNSILNRLLTKPLKSKDHDILALLLLGIYQLDYLNTPDHAAISTAVNGSKALKKPWATKLINGVLRNYQRQKSSLTETLKDSPAHRTAHPNWLRKAIEGHWPDASAQIFAANNHHPPLTLRLNTVQRERENYIAELASKGLEAVATRYSPCGVTLLKPTDVTSLPGFKDGYVSVQDEAAQLCAALMQLLPGQRVLDACSAPGGKTCHLLEHADTLAAPLSELVALDLEQRRLDRVQENLTRIQPILKWQTPIQLLQADAGQLDDWWDGVPFDRILLDAPCSATGVIRRNPDIKLLRKVSDIAKLAMLQQHLLQQLWLTLKPDGVLVYATCSTLPEENSDVIKRFLASEDSAQALPMEVPWGLAQPAGRQLLATREAHDGFYYACLRKRD